MSQTPVRLIVLYQTVPLELLTQTTEWSLGGRPAPGEEVDSASGGAPPRVLQAVPPFQNQSWLSVPCTKRWRASSTPGPVLGASFPPRDFQLDQAEPLQTLDQHAPSVPRTKTWMLLLAGYVATSNVAAGDEVSFPPSDCQLDHDVPVHALCHRAPSVPCTKMSSRPADHEETAGPVPDASCPPRDSHVDHPFW